MITVTVVHVPGETGQVRLAEQVVGEVIGGLPGTIELRTVSPADLPARYGYVAPPAVIVDDLVVSTGAAVPAPRLRQFLLRALRQAGLDVGPIPGDDPGQEFRLVTDGPVVHLEVEDYMAGEGCEPMLLFWHVDPGQPVAEGQELAEIETAKAVLVLESPVEGVLEAVHVPPGEPVTPGLRLATIRPRIEGPLQGGSDNG